eukprot:CAMPEP_0172540192 /NCGR_PEP_ID=MMETSP1067-20121228/11261_1 /TAXON_ID=265564 ORGANISM="Thalassiosira punctigera, Strain Tpunct2005C2" /NCGR_SAMPLE_ID=MMETSP1067 /ASSEMBLY_ACC=CAM_ASM_000444 /LENGTH=72 /DNA_ID=CAMNT_0013326005 /DNA_START=265 /DNA_END=480 /DNA_ORIENTATION=-
MKEVWRGQAKESIESLREQSNQVKQIRVGSLKQQLEEKYKDLFHATRLMSHEVKTLKKDVVAAKESTQSVRE